MSKFRINPGKFRHQITVQKNSRIRNEFGEYTDVWQDFKVLRAAIYPLSGKDYYAAETLNSEITHKVNIRYTEGITSGMRINFKGRYFEIISPPINFQEKGVLIQLMCKERTYEDEV